MESSILVMSKAAGGNEFQVENIREEKLRLCHVSFNTLWSDLSLSQYFVSHIGCQRGLSWFKSPSQTQVSPPSGQLPPFICQAWHFVVWNISLLSLGHLSQLCCLPVSFVYLLTGIAWDKENAPDLGWKQLSKKPKHQCAINTILIPNTKHSIVTATEKKWILLLLKPGEPATLNCASLPLLTVFHHKMPFFKIRLWCFYHSFLSSSIYIMEKKTTHSGATSSLVAKAFT